MVDCFVTAIASWVDYFSRCCLVACCQCIRPLNLVIISQDGTITIKLIDFDASAKHGEPCHLKFSSAFAPPQLAAELLEYESATGCKPTDASAPRPWAEWIQSRGTLMSSVSIDIWSFGVLAFKLCVEDGASMFLSSEADNIVQRADLETLAYGWEQRKLEEIKRVVWSDAADMILKCLQVLEARRASSFGELEQHPFFDEVEEGQEEDAHQVVKGRLYFADPVDERAQKFHTAVQSDDSVATVKKLLDGGGVHAGLLLPSIGDTAAVSCATPLHRVARFGQLQIVKLLVQELQHTTRATTTVFDAQTVYGFTALHFACQYGFVDAAEALIAAGINTELTNYRGQTAYVLSLLYFHPVLSLLYFHFCTFTFFRWDIAEACQQSTVIESLTALAEKTDEPHEALSGEKARRARRPEVATTFREDIELDMIGFTFWCIELFDNWKKLAEGAFGLVYHVTNLLSIEINGRHFHEAAVKVPKAGECMFSSVFTLSCIFTGLVL